MPGVTALSRCRHCNTVTRWDVGTTLTAAAGGPIVSRCGLSQDIPDRDAGPMPADQSD